MRRACSSTYTRREVLATGASAAAALALPKLGNAFATPAPAASVAIVRCRDYASFQPKLSDAFQQIGGIDRTGARQNRRYQIEPYR